MADLRFRFVVELFFTFNSLKSEVLFIYFVYQHGVMVGVGEIKQHSWITDTMMWHTLGNLCIDYELIDAANHQYCSTNTICTLLNTKKSLKNNPTGYTSLHSYKIMQC